MLSCMANAKITCRYTNRQQKQSGSNPVMLIALFGAAATEEVDMKIWISKYALSSGIKEVECEKITAEGYAYPVGTYIGFKMGRDAHVNREDAVAQAEKSKISKIASLEKQIKKFRNKSF